MDKVAVISYTGMSACVLIRKGLPASTVHRFIYVPIENEDHTISFILKDKNDLAEFELVIIDEISMISDELMDDILKFEIPVIALGDDFQLQPIGGKINRFVNQVDGYLDEPVRQALDSPIIYLANQLRNKIKPKVGTMSGNGTVSIYRNEFDLDEFSNADQILAGKNVTVQNLNRLYRYKFKGYTSKYPQEGDKLICLRNNWSQYCNEDGIELYLVNGLNGYASNITYYERTKTFKMNFKPYFFEKTRFLKICGDTLLFDDLQYKEFNYLKGKNPIIYNARLPLIMQNTSINQFDYGYVITVYKSQGSEWNNVFYFDEVLNWKTYFNHFYTACTRAKENLSIVLQS